MLEMMRRFPESEDLSVNLGIVTNLIESAQKKKEYINFEQRKNVLLYDDVMNQQRAVMYKQRNDVLDGVDMRSTITGMIEKQVALVVSSHTNTEEKENWNVEGLRNHYFGVIAGDLLNDDKIKDISHEELTEKITERAMAIYCEKEALLGEARMRDIERNILLRHVDLKWMDHIDAMADLKDNVGLSAYAQKNPLNEYRIIGADMFDEMVEEIRENTVRTVLFFQIQSAPVARKAAAKAIQAGADGEKPKQQPVRNAAPKVGANAPCPCGSGKKYKNCCGYKSGKN
jgi:preprotein translocase subunit SecA